MQSHDRSDTTGAGAAAPFSVIVTTYDDPWSLTCVLAAVAAQTLPPAEVIVADDGSDPETAEAVRAFAAPAPFAVLHVRQPHEGFRAARSRNNAVAAASCPNLAFLDQDTMPHPGWLACHAAALGTGCVSLGASLNLPPERKVELTPELIRSGRFTEWHTTMDLRRLRRFHLKSNAYAVFKRFGLAPLNRPSLRSGNFAIRRESMLLVNGFDESFVGWGQEDDDLGRRLYLAGIRPVVTIWKARITHIPHPRRHGSREDGANIQKHRARITESRTADGMDRRPYPDVVVTRMNAVQVPAADREPGSL